MSLGLDRRESSALGQGRNKPVWRTVCGGSSWHAPLYSRLKVYKAVGQPHLWHSCSLFSLLDYALKRAGGRCGASQQECEATTSIAAAVIH